MKALDDYPRVLVVDEARDEGINQGLQTAIDIIGGDK